MKDTVLTALANLFGITAGPLLTKSEQASFAQENKQRTENFVKHVQAKIVKVKKALMAIK